MTLPPLEMWAGVTYFDRLAHERYGAFSVYPEALAGCCTR